MKKTVALNTMNPWTSTSQDIITYIKPQIIYVPLESKTGVKYKHLVKEGEYVYKGDVIAMNEEIKFPIHSSVSGYVVRGENKYINTGEKIKCIVIENDFKEKYRESKGSKRNINKYSKEEFIQLLQNSGITGLGGSDFPTFKKYQLENPKYLLVNGVECEPYLTCDKSIIKHHAEDILEAIDAILEMMQMKESYIVVKDTDITSINELNKYIGTYPNIKIATMKDGYPSGWERNMVSHIFHKQYKSYPTEIGIIVNNVSTIYAIYEMLKYNRPLTERVITITGDKIEKPTNIKVKIGSSITEILPYVKGYKEVTENTIFIAGGPMTGNSLPTDDIIITKDLGGIIVTTDNSKETTCPCIKCGKCNEVCPVGLIPNAIMKNKDNPKVLKDLEPSRCIECGLCSYICPSKIKLRDQVIEAKGCEEHD